MKDESRGAFLKMVNAQILNKTRNTVIASRSGFALRHNERRRGLTGRPGLECGEAVVFPGCRQIHTFGMLFPIDVVFVDRRGVIRKTYRNLVPGRLTGIMFRGIDAVELAAGTLERTNTQSGDLIGFSGNSGAFFEKKRRYY